jgi:hypothetical protein
MEDPVSELCRAAYVANVAVVRSLLAAGAKPDGDEATTPTRPRSLVYY